MDANKAERLARRLMREHGVDHWSFQWGRGVRQMGSANFTQEKLTLSRHFVELNGEEVITDTILHEIAHILAGFKAGHGPEWRRVARRVGANPQRCGDAVAPEHKYKATCATCGAEYKRHRRPKNGAPSACSVCCNKLNRGRWDARFVLVWVDTKATAGVR